MPQAKKERFTYENGKMKEAGIEVDDKRMSSYLERQKRAMENNKSQGMAGEFANKILQPEYDNAAKVYDSWKKGNKK